MKATPDQEIWAGSTGLDAVGGATGEFSDRSAQNPPSRGAQSVFLVEKKFPHGLQDFWKTWERPLHDGKLRADFIFAAQ